MPHPLPQMHSHPRQGPAPPRVLGTSPQTVLGYFCCSLTFSKKATTTGIMTSLLAPCMAPALTWSLLSPLMPQRRQFTYIFLIVHVFGQQFPNTWSARKPFIMVLTYHLPGRVLSTLYTLNLLILITTSIIKFRFTKEKTKA